MIKVLSISSVYPHPGNRSVGTFVHTRLLHLSAFADVRVIAPVAVFDYGSRRWAPRTLNPSGDDLQVIHPRWGYFPGGGFTNALLLGLRLIATTASVRSTYSFELLDAHFGFPEGVATALVAGFWSVPFIVTLRGCELLHARYRMRRLWMAWALRRAARVVAVSRELAGLAVQLGVPADRISIIPNGIDCSIYFPRLKAEARAKYGLPLHQKLVLSAGHLIPLKGHQHVITAIAVLRARGIDAELWIAGGSGHGFPHYADTLREWAQRSGLSRYVRLLGHVSPVTLAELMSAADVFCHASSREGWPNVVHEALACGTPVVATAVGAIPEMIASSRYGIVIPDTGSALQDALACAVEATWNREEIAAWGQSRSWQQVAREVFEIVRQAVTENGAPTQ